MNPSSWFDAGGDSSVREVLWEDDERVVCRTWRDGADGDRHAVLAVLPAAEHPTPGSLNRLTHEYGLKDDLDGAWAVRPLELVRERGQTMLVLKDPGASRSIALSARPWRSEDSCASPSPYRPRSAGCTNAASIHKDIKPTQYPCQFRDRPGLADGLWHRFAPSARAPVARTSRVHRRNTRLHGARTDRTDEPFDRFPE